LVSSSSSACTARLTCTLVTSAPHSRSSTQIETYARQRAAADQLRVLNDAQAQANLQAEITGAQVQVQIAASKGEADLARARKQAEQTVVVAEAELARSRREAEQTVVLAEAESQKRILAGRGEGQEVMQVGLAEASVLLRKIASYGDPRLYALAQGPTSSRTAPSRLCRSGCSWPAGPAATAAARNLAAAW
jgi:hypothetical protein